MKAFTDLNQSKKLAEILPLESADMFWMHVEEKSPKIDFWKVEIIQRNFKPYSMNIPCWSLAALLEVIPSGQVNFIRLPLNGENRYTIQVLCGEEWKFGDWKSNLIDACVEMIYKLKEKDLL